MMIRQSVVAAASVARQSQRQSQLRSIHASSVVGSRLYDSIVDTIGETPIVRLNNLAPEGVNVYGKCEFFNPSSSVKDRLALGAVLDAERKGLLKPGDTIVEATSGNTGISLAMVCAARGYKLVITMAEPFSVERRKVMRMMGAQVVITPAAQKGTGMVKKAKELAEAHGWFQTRQFENPANADYHARTTGPEVLRAFADRNLDYFVLGWGTGGTVNGAGRVIKAASPDTKVVTSEPETAALLTSGVPQQREADGSPAETHSAFAPHPIQGWTPDFIPTLLETAQAAKSFDEVMPVDPKKALETSRLLASKEGIFTGISGGASMAVALQIASTAPPGTNICAILADTSERYLSTPLYEPIAADMDEGELVISKSTPNFQL